MLVNPRAFFSGNFVLTDSDAALKSKMVKWEMSDSDANTKRATSARSQDISKYGDETPYQSQLETKMMYNQRKGSELVGDMTQPGIKSEVTANKSDASVTLIKDNTPGDSAGSISISKNLTGSKKLLQINGSS
jgi:hypothetical protein